MRTDISVNWLSRIRDLDYKKVIIIAFLLRIIFAAGYDIFVSITNKDIIVPDSKFYSVKGRYINLLLEGYDKFSITKNLIPRDKAGQDILYEDILLNNFNFPRKINEQGIFSYITGIIYTIFGYADIWVRIFNILISIFSVYLLFKVSRKHFGVLASNLFLVISLYLPAQFGYSITLARDFLRVFIVALIIWVIYG